MCDIQFQNQVLRYYIYNHNSSPYHQWNDGWAFWGDLGKAIKELNKYIRKARVLADTKEKWGAYRVYVISLYDGTLKSLLQPSVRRDFDWWYHSDLLHNLIMLERKDPNSNFYAFVSDVADDIDTFIRNKVATKVNWFLEQVSRVDYFIAQPHLPFYHEFCFKEEDYKHPILHKIDTWIKKHIRFIPKTFIKWVQQKQKQKVNEGFQKVCLKYPHIVHELVNYVDCYDWIKPYGKYILDGNEIHKQHWTRIV